MSLTVPFTCGAAQIGRRFLHGARSAPARQSFGICQIRWGLVSGIFIKRFIRKVGGTTVLALSRCCATRTGCYTSRGHLQLQRQVPLRPHSDSATAHSRPVWASCMACAAICPVRCPAAVTGCAVPSSRLDARISASLWRRRAARLGSRP